MITKSKFAFILGPCVIEDEAHALRHATTLRRLSETFNVPVIYKSSYLKDNRTSGQSARGPGIVAGCDVLREVRKILPTITDVHSVDDVKYVKLRECVDVLQIPAMLSRQTSLLGEAGRPHAEIYGLPETTPQVFIKKMITMNAEQAFEAVRKVGREDTVICERGTFLGYGRTVIDFEQVERLTWGKYPVAVDVTHPATYPDYCLPLAKAACAIGVDAIFAECHEDPDKAPSDGGKMLRLSDVPAFMEGCLNARFK